MTEFLQSYGILILIGVVLLFLFILISRRPTQENPSRHKDIGNQDRNDHRHGGCC
jgi:hypothetical protein